jgi:DNA polymerase-3 subunit gamma/tau
MLVVKIGPQPQRLVDLPATEIQRIQDQAQGLSGSALGQALEFLCRQEQFVRFAAYPRLAVEMVVVRLAQIKPALSIEELIAALDDLRRQPGPEPGAQSPGAGHYARVVGPDPAPAPTPSPPPLITGPATAVDPAQVWSQMVETLRRRQPSLATVLAKARLKALESDTLVIEPSGGDFQVGLIQQNLAAIGKACQQVTGRPMGVRLAPAEPRTCPAPAGPDRRTAAEQPSADHAAIGEVLDVLGGTVIDIKSI